VVLTEATTGRGIPELMAEVDRFRAQGEAGRRARRATRASWRLRELLGGRFLQLVESRVLAPGEWDALVQRIADRELDPYTASDAIMARALGAARG
jgi:putative protein kinase ArgK-like GTPase of G3E family